MTPDKGTYWANQKGDMYEVQLVTDDSIVVYRDIHQDSIWSKHISTWYLDMIHLKNYRHSNTRTNSRAAT